MTNLSIIKRLTVNEIVQMSKKDKIFSFNDDNTLIENDQSKFYCINFKIFDTINYN